MKKTKKQQQSEGNTWSQDQQIMFELALDTITSFSAIFSRISYYIEDKEKEEVYSNRSVEIHKETNFFNGFDDDIINDIVDTYSPLIREYYDMDGSDEEIAKKGDLPDKYFTTRVHYAKYGRWV